MGHCRKSPNEGVAYQLLESVFWLGEVLCSGPLPPGFDSSRPKTPIFHSTTPVFMRVSGRISGNACNGMFGLLK